MVAKSEEPVCNRDCFHCIHPDCILDQGPDAGERRQMAQRDREFSRTPEQQKRCDQYKANYRRTREKVLARAKKYREQNLEKCRAAGRANYAANREERIAYQRAYDKENREKIRAQRRNYYAANREKICAKSRAHYAANREKMAEYDRERYMKRKQPALEQGE